MYEAMDISVLTSHSEGLSITLLESMAFGLPIVVTAVGGNVDVVVDGQTGYLVPPNDTSSFATAVASLVGNPVKRREMGAAARKRCEARYDVRAVNRSYEELYLNVIHKKAAGSQR